MKYYNFQANLGIANNPRGNLVTFGDGAYAMRDALKAAGFACTKWGHWTGPEATVENYRAAVKALFGVDVETAGLRNVERAAWA